MNHVRHTVYHFVHHKQGYNILIVGGNRLCLWGATMEKVQKCETLKPFCESLYEPTGILISLCAVSKDDFFVPCVERTSSAMPGKRASCMNCALASTLACVNGVSVVTAEKSA